MTMNTPRELRKFPTLVIPVHVDKVELAKHRRELAILRYELMRKTGMRWRKDETEAEPEPVIPKAGKGG
jgi:hypothetical protein